MGLGGGKVPVKLNTNFDTQAALTWLPSPTEKSMEKKRIAQI